jgi:hypothetical protein
VKIKRQIVEKEGVERSRAQRKHAGAPKNAAHVGFGVAAPLTDHGMQERDDTAGVNYKTPMFLSSLYKR